MSLPHTLLGLLKYKPNTGYNIKTAFASSINFFWEVSLPQIYRTLNSMETRGWLDSDIEHQDGRPSKKIYRITPEGDREFAQWLEQAPEAVKPKDELLVKLFFGGFMDHQTLTGHIKDRRNKAEQFLKSAGEIIPPSVREYADKADAGQDIPFWLLTLDLGRRRAQMTIEWCDETLRILEKNNRKKEES
ncbi:MAG: PadR family transcriptional regulator [Proteobacteria bacterium]|nr:PadR family transcriptional regulator [Pseudomonadota bacterium]MBU1388410.1 PadR family transcriptional regulator [Pseudomonadota bacterium]MBU1542766.1 PadR family transcriptional regulator [Pseudomonadota bacterium]MBU2480155.1 PadR family transcriptional regulator [Pseudomonadota bacterium]